jgi:hypothetical protein
MISNHSVTKDKWRTQQVDNFNSLFNTLQGKAGKGFPMNNAIG